MLGHHSACVTGHSSSMKDTKLAEGRREAQARGRRATFADAVSCCIAVPAVQSHRRGARFPACVAEQDQVQRLGLSFSVIAMRLVRSLCTSLPGQNHLSQGLVAWGRGAG